jgi:cytochrome c-type biogenesis protein CcmH
MKLLSAALLLAFTAIATAQNDEQAARYQALIAELRCLVCQNQTIAESNAPLAADLREQVRAQIEAGRSDAEIIEFVTARYGDFVLYRPPFKPSTWLLWLGPFAVLVLAGGVVFAFVSRSRAEHAPAEHSPSVDVPAKAGIPGARFSPTVLALASLGVLGFAAVWYILAGSWRTQMLVDLARTNPAAAEQAAFEQMLARLQQHVKDQPDDADGWAWLGRSYMKRERYPEAAAALARANEITAGRDPDLLVEEGEALAYAQDRSLSGAPLAKFEAALTLAPDHPRALWFAGLAALHAGDQRAALKHWERLLTQELPDEVRASLEHSLAQIRERTGIVEGAAPASRPLRLTIGIAVAPELLTKVRPEDTLFVYAQAPGEGNMPLAVRRLENVTFPLQVSLDDSHSMVPTRKLSGAQRWRLVARLSHSGNAQPQPGDLEGELQVERAQAWELQQLTINRRHDEN